MKTNTEKLTFGAMTVAIFGVMLLINRQTGDLFQEMLLFAYPIPMVAFSTKYGWKDSLAVLASMALMAFLLGTFTTIFYAVSEAFVGMVFGARIHAKKDMTHTLIIIMALQALSNILTTIVLAALFGYDFNRDIAEMQTLMNEAMAKAGMPAEVGSLLTVEYLRRLYIISMILLGIMEGFVIYGLSLIILRKLRFAVPKPSPITEFIPPAWTGYTALVLFILYYISLLYQWQNQQLKAIVETAGTCGYIFLLVFAFIAGIVFLRRRGVGKLATVLLVFLATMMFPQFMMFLGFAYISTSYRYRILGTEPPQTPAKL